jgi:hypothetical protein
MGNRELVRRGVIVGAIGVLSLTVASMGIATAANGGSLLLGHANVATKTTTLRDAKGTPLSLVGKKSKPPLTVNSSKQVPHLNASLLGGQTAAGLATSGSSAYFGPDDDISLSKNNDDATLIVGTKLLSAGTYFVEAFAETVDQTAVPAEGVRCFVGEDSDFTDSFVSSGSVSTGTQTESETVGVTLDKPAALSEYCDAIAGDTADVSSAGIVVTRIARATTGTNAAG